MPRGYRLIPTRANKIAPYPCQAALSVIEFLQMRRSANHPNGWLRLSLAGLMSGLTLILSLLASSDSLHQVFHRDLGGQQGQCALCSFHQGKLDAPQSEEVTASVPVSVVWTGSRCCSEFVSDFDFSLSPNRGPPALKASI